MKVHRTIVMQLVTVVSKIKLTNLMAQGDWASATATAAPHMQEAHKCSASSRLESGVQGKLSMSIHILMRIVLPIVFCVSNDRYDGKEKSLTQTCLDRASLPQREGSMK